MAAKTKAAPSAAEVTATLKSMANKKVRDGMARYAIPSDHALGIPVGALRQLGKKLGPSQALAIARWKIGIYEARMLASSKTTSRTNGLSPRTSTVAL